MRDLLEFLQKKLGSEKEFWQEDEYGYGSTERGFSPSFEVDFEQLSADIDAFAQSFIKGDKNA